MPLFNSFVSWIIKKRIHQIELFQKYPIDVQQEWFRKLLHDARDTEWGKMYDYKSIRSFKTFQERVPINDYEALKPYIDKHRQGESNILWPTEIMLFAKSSGTTANKSKYIPVSQEALNDCHYKGGKDMLSIYCNNHPETQIFSGRSLAVGGSRDISFETEKYYGDLSAIIMDNLPFWAEVVRTPELSIALMDKWEEKIQKMAEATMTQNVTNFSGVPSWTLLLLNKIMELGATKDIHHIWPNLELYVHGGVSFSPYKDMFKQLTPSRSINYLETYNASEGFFGIQDQTDNDSMLLMLDYGIFYEFIPMDELKSDHPKTLTLSDVQTHTNYAMVISTNAGLWRYLIGDTVVFTSLYPFRIKITGRTRSYINAFGEEVIIDNAENALAIACEKTNAIVNEYTVAPLFINNKTKAAHEWFIEFSRPPDNLDYFTELLDNALKSVNSDYEAKRYHNLMLQMPIIHVMPAQTFYNWLKSKGKLGGQYKVPRLSNDRKIADELNEHIAQLSVQN